MAQISQNADGTYSKTYSDTEILILQQLQNEIDTRKNADDQLLVQIIDHDNRLDALEGERFSLAEIQNAINANTLRIDEHELRISGLEQSMVIDAYSKQEIDQMMIPWFVEEISQAFDTPTEAMFDEANLKDIRTGYVHYLKGNINEPYSLQFPPNTMRRYSTSAYTSVPREVEFAISYADRCVVLLNGTELATYQEDGGNFNGTQKVLKMNLVPGWNRIVFLVANETQQGGLVVTSLLANQVERLNPLSKMSGKITGEQIQQGTLGEEHFSPNMDIVLKKIHATTTSEPAGLFGDPDTYGAIQIADGVISKTKDEPLTFHSDIKVMGYIRDKDGNILDGGGGSGLSTADREKLDSIEWGAEVNQNAFSYVKLVDLPTDPANPFQNVINSILKMDTLRIRGDLGIVFEIETVKNEANEDVQQLVIENSPTVFKSVLLISEDQQDTFSIDPAAGKFQLGRGVVFVYIEGNKQSYANFYEVDEWTIRLREKLPAGLSVLIEWQEGSPQFARETIVSLANLPIATRTEDGLMSRFMVEDLYDHTHKVSEIVDLNTFTGIEIDDGTTVHHIDPTGLQKIKLKAGKNIKLEKLNDVLRITAVGPTLSEGKNIRIAGDAENGYQIINDQRLEVARGLKLEHIDGIDLISGPIFKEGKGIDIRTIDDVTYEVLNNMSLTSRGGITVSGNAEDGYVIDNAMVLEADPRGGILVQGDPRRGYSLRNIMSLQGDGIAVEGNASEGFVLRNKATLIEGGGIDVQGDINSGYKIINTMSLQAAARGSLVITGSAQSGYTATGLWPSITGSTGIAVDDHGDGTFTVRNEGVTSYNGQIGAVVGVGTLNKVQKGLGIEVSFMGGGDYVVSNTGVIDLVDDDVRGGIDVREQANGVWKIINTGIIQVLQGPGISVSTNAQGQATVTNTGIHRIFEGRGIDVQQSGNDVYVINTGLLGATEGEGIDVVVSDQTAYIRNTGVIGWTATDGTVQNNAGRITYTPPAPPVAQRGVAATFPFSEWGQEYSVWMKTSRDSTMFYCYGVKEPTMRYFNVEVFAAVDSSGQRCEVGLYSGTSNTVLDSAVCTSVRASMDGESIILTASISHIADWKMTGVHVFCHPDSGDTGYVRVNRAWLSVAPASPGDYQV